jgi:uncharacterized damage-inducible protein DinB
MIPEILDLYAYNRWANDRVLDAAAALTPVELDRDLKSSFPSVRETLAHILTAEWVWLSRWNGVSPGGPPAGWDLSTLDGIRGRWSEVERERAALLASLDDDALERTIDYRNTKGEPFSSPLVHLLRHVVNHSSYHRGQVVTMLRQLGHAAPATDLVIYHRQTAPSGLGQVRVR